MTNTEDSRPWGTMSLRRPALAVSAALIAMSGALAAPQTAAASSAPAGASAAVSASAVAVPLNRQVRIRSRVVGSTANGREVTGRFVPRRFVVRNGVLIARGVLYAEIHRANGTVRRITQPGVRLPVAQINTPSSQTDRGAALSAAEASAALAPGACNILNLVLGPLDLDLLGLQVHLDRVVLNIVAQSGAGNLLGNLLCAVAGLLDAGQLGSLLQQLANLLNDILAIINS